MQWMRKPTFSSTHYQHITEITTIWFDVRWTWRSCTCVRVCFRCFNVSSWTRNSNEKFDGISMSVEWELSMYLKAEWNILRIPTEKSNQSDWAVDTKQ